MSIIFKKETLSRVITILHYIAIISMIFLFVYSLFAWLSTSNVWGFGDIFWSSWMTFSFVYLGIAALLKMKGVPIVESFVISVTSTVSMIWLYEILYHFSFWDSWNYGTPPYFILKMNVNFLDYGLISLGALSGFRYMKANKWLWIVLLTMSALWIFWIMIGFPQLIFPKELYNFFLPRIVIANPHALAYPINALTKFLLGAAYVLLYLPSGQKLSETKEYLKNFLSKRAFYKETLVGKLESNKLCVWLNFNQRKEFIGEKITTNYLYEFEILSILSMCGFTIVSITKVIPSQNPLV